MKTYETRLDLLRSFPKGLAVAELGVFVGTFSAAILEICHPSLLYLIDTWSGSVECGDENGENVVVEDLEAIYPQIIARYDRHPAARVLRSTIVSALAEFGERSLDVTYLDADHSYMAVSRDLRAAARVTRRWLAGHDYCERFDGTRRAVNDFCQDSGWSITALTCDGCPSYMLERAA